MAMEASAASAGFAAERLPGQTVGEAAAPAAAANPELDGGRELEESGRWGPVLGLPCELTVELPLPGFKIADLLRLGAGAVINASWPVERDVPLRLNGTLIGWSEFEVVGDSLAVRLTELV
jgi:flagellar motor switch/type III secretory pathway protein FliN